ncbi:hypothetical protein PRIPAC_87996 [Pristionchus pacificus]|uniref:Uncharacterized protein n=1 Tax=Pristionchus pacificus TaxID=54126 RepID=A0A2A6CZ53_PRIPA|nr:hypothetical protein PRIPAC_87996 [Pristionchus pacificus]|eukprot:PDM83408.1 hypothetical protein PRIPAC_35040 [Pristionchus pacificus]
MVIPSDQFPLMDRNRSIIHLCFISIIDWTRMCASLQLISLVFKCLLYWDDLSSLPFSILSLILTFIYSIFVIASIVLVFASIRLSSDNCIAGAAFCSILLSFLGACIAPITLYYLVTLSRLSESDPIRVLWWSSTLHSFYFLLFSLPVNIISTIVYGTLTEHFEKQKNGIQ